MIARISGTLVESSFTEIIVDVNGVGYRLLIPMSTFDKLPPEGGKVTLRTHMHVREDAILLYGFATPEEKELFEVLITVSGIGAKIALNVLSSMPVASLCTAIADGDINVMKRINGIGKRTAERLIVELRDRVGKLGFTSSLEDSKDIGPATGQAAEDAVLALQQLGFKHDQASKAVHKLLADLPEAECSSENLIRKALQSLNR